MLNRLNLLSRHFAHPFGFRPTTPTLSPLRPGPLAMTSAHPNFTKPIHTAACLIIGDEVLGGKTIDTNSPFLAKFCFGLGIQLKRVEVIPDDEEDIMEAVRRMSARYDFVVTSGGIGPTHDDITYRSVAKAFNLKLQLHEAAFARMKRLSKPHPMQPNFDWETPSPGLTAKLRMVELPYDPTVPAADQALFVAEDMWVPIAVVNGNVHILPGVPRLFERLLMNLQPSIKPRLAHLDGKATERVMISTPLPESAVAPYLTELAAKVEPKGVKVGSYPRWGRKRNTVTLVGADKDYLESLVQEVEENVQGKRVSKEDELDPKDEGETVYSQ
ncbi:uncharacterized protein N7477_004568 [Penicillium maclennaniae]|uniref:uncharacterized protein n=1 Tax=Penicillium maclennaniae TaxID=1343394 RepID=UPI002540D2A0|nr:uncharacterized protein N7477_004568 [Penicillium maclennaniae]KAJ5674634.1 hypothetical protein N7477_004568 [Penicillium maclennaniae]